MSLFSLPPAVFPSLSARASNQTSAHSKNSASSLYLFSMDSSLVAARSTNNSSNLNRPNNLHTWDLWKIVLRIFKHRNVEFIVAPTNLSERMTSSSTYNATPRRTFTRSMVPQIRSSTLVLTR
ncbi:hypothetical protein BC628DRAFT_568489 [Trametes gibbosa]|nr:hypothetical protein BC628DRAFT_568489 [Trametes gibbosa]